MKRSFRGLATFLGGAAFVALTCFAGPNCQPSGGDLGGNSGEQGGSGDGGSSHGGSGGSGQGGSAQGGSGDGGQGGKASGGSGGSDATGGKTSNGGSGSGGKSSGGSGGSGDGGKASGGSGGSNNGGTTTSAGGSSAGGTPSAGGSTTPAGGASGGSTGAVTCTTDLMTLRTGTDANWIPSNPQSCGVQGAVYAYSDGSTCTSPSPISATPCVSGSAGCCISGATVVDEKSTKWGCGLGIDLNSSGGTSATKSAYAGTAKGFKITLSGTVATGQKIRIMYSSAETDPTGGTSPYKEVTGVGTYSVLFSDATCPTWATGTKCSVVSGSAAYAIKVQIAGGSTSTDSVGAFKDLCITSLTPL
jgi:hypothetical protein